MFLQTMVLYLQKVFCVSRNRSPQILENRTTCFKLSTAKNYFTFFDMLFLTQSASVYGIDALIVDIEVNLRPPAGENDTSPNITIVGLPDTAVRESKERIRAAINNSRYFFPIMKTTVNLAPAD